TAREGFAAALDATLRQRDGDAVGVGQTPGASIELPPAEATTACLPIPLRLGACDLPTPQHSSNARQQFAKPERPGDTIIGTKLDPDDPVALVAARVCGHDPRDVGTRADLVQQVQPIIPAEAQVEKHQTRLADSSQ